MGLMFMAIRKCSLPAPAMRLAAIVLVSLVATGCAADRVATLEHALEVGASHYPPGTDIRTFFESSHADAGLGGWGIDGFCDTLEDGFATAALAYAAPTTRPIGYYRVTTPRSGPGSSFGAVGMYFDYVFVDQDDRVVFAARRRVD